MKKRFVKRVTSCIVAVMMFGMCFTQIVVAKNDVKVSTTDYIVEMNNSTNFFLYNRESIGSKVGTEYYLTYTVESIEAEEYFLEGILGSNIPTAMWPYVKNNEGGGLLKYNMGNGLLVEGNTYFYKFVITEDGYEYEVGWANDENGKSEYVEFELATGEVKTDLTHFGVWFADIGLNGKLTKVRFYDKEGNDLGVKVTANTGVTIGREIPIPKDTKVDHSYELTLDNVNNIAISNKRKPLGDKVYIEYKVKSSDSLVWQNGIVLGNDPTAAYPYLNGYMLYDFYEYDPTKVDDGPLLTEGAEYLIVFEKKDTVFDVTIQCTLNGKTTYHEFPHIYGLYRTEGEFYSLWFGDGPNFPVNAVLTDFKCYDSNKNNLGVQTNVACNIVHYGELEDYAGCESMYYCKDKMSLFALYEDKKLKYTVNEKTESGTYSIEDAIMTTEINAQTDTYDYLYQYFTDEDKNVYERLQTYKVVFETGTGSAVEEQVLDADNGYMPMRPNDPTCEGNTFEGWYTVDGEEYQFGGIETESLTLYARWAEVDYVDVKISGLRGYMPHIAIGVSAVLVVGAVIGGITIVGRGKKNGSRKKDEKAGQ